MISTIATTSTMYDYGFTLDSSVKLWLPFWYVPGSSPNITDRSGNGNNATIIGAVPTTLASPAIGWYCDGTDDRFTLPNVFTTNQTGLTILSWVYCHSFKYFDGTAYRNMIYTNWSVNAVNEGFLLRMHSFVDNQNRWSFQIYNSATSINHVTETLSNTTMTSTYANKWLCICGSFEASTRMKLWINGTAAITDKTADVLDIMVPETANEDRIANDLVGNFFSNFTYGEIAIFNRPFSDTELRNYYQTTRGRYKA